MFIKTLRLSPLEDYCLIVKGADPQEGTGESHECLSLSGESHRPQESNCMMFLKGYNHRKGQAKSDQPPAWGTEGQRKTWDPLWVETGRLWHSSAIGMHSTADVATLHHLEG